jgi:amidase
MSLWHGKYSLAKTSSRRTFLAQAALQGLGLIVATRTAPAIQSGQASINERGTKRDGDVILRSATEMARMVRAKTISAEELVRAHLARISQVNGALNAICQVDEAGALAAAREADAAMARGDKAGPLHGVPITIKDSFDTKGIISTGGTSGRRRFIPTRDATAVARLRAAGAIILGKTNVPELTLSYETENQIYGRTNNPYDLTRTCGGSSGGAGAILAVGGSALDLGSDTAGSIRIPAHFCGIAGLKPTFGRVSRAGHILPPGGVVGGWTHVGPMARYVEDLGLMLAVIAGEDAADPDAVAATFQQSAIVDTKALRIAFFTEDGRSIASAPLREAVKSAVDLLTADGLKCEQARPGGFDAGRKISRFFNDADGGDYYQRLLKRYGTTAPDPSTKSFLNAVTNGVVSGREYSAALLDWTALREASLKFMERFDILICPPCSGAAPKHGQSALLDYSYSSFFNLLGWPAAVVRAGKTPDGLPVGVQIVGRPWRESQVLAVARRIEEKLGGWKKDFLESALISLIKK